MNDFYMNFPGLTGLVTMTLSLLIPIVAIALGMWKDVKHKEQDTLLRRMIIENHVDIDSARLLIADAEKKPNRFKMLRWGSMFVGLGLGALFDFLLGIDTDSGYFWIVLAVGLGVGMLVAFAVEMKLKWQQNSNHDRE